MTSHPSTLFDGLTATAADDARLSRQLRAVRDLMLDGHWRTLAEIRDAAGGSEAGVSARLRDLRKERYGSYRVVGQRKSGGLWHYRVTVKGAGLE